LVWVCTETGSKENFQTLQACDGTALYGSEKRKLEDITTKEIYASVKKPTVTEKIRWFGYVQRLEVKRISRHSRLVTELLYMAVKKKIGGYNH